MGNNFWKFGDKYAGIAPRGKRFVVDTKAEAQRKAGTKSDPKTGKTTAKKPKKGGSKRTTSKKGKGGRRGARIVGNLGIKGLGIGAALLAAAKYLVRAKAPQLGAYTTAVANVGAGLVGKTVFGTGSSLIQFGAVDGLSELLYDIATPGGAYDLPGIKTGGAVRWNF